MECVTRSGKNYTKIFTRNSDSESDPDSSRSLYDYTISTPSASSPSPGTSDFDEKVAEQV